jgi:sec-independent protein translocase protein TatA
MQAMSGASIILALLNLGGGEIVLILAVILVLFGSKHLPLLARGLGRGILEFHDATKQVTLEISKGSAASDAYDAGRSLGGIYGKPAAQAITADNHVAELYDPAVFRPKRRPDKRLTRIVASFVQPLLRLCKVFLSWLALPSQRK